MVMSVVVANDITTEDNKDYKLSSEPIRINRDYSFQYSFPNGLRKSRDSNMRIDIVDNDNKRVNTFDVEVEQMLEADLGSDENLIMENRIFKNNQRNRFYFLPFNFNEKENEIILHFYLNEREVFTKNLIFTI
jgi:hypothetical protein